MATSSSDKPSSATTPGSAIEKKDGAVLISHPKVFISYSWTSPGYQDRVRKWAESLINDGVEIVMDIFDLKEGHEKNSFMERMVSDQSVTHVLVISDKAYAEKSDARKAGVGTESQIISQEIYAKVGQSKFIPIVCEFTKDGEPYLPIFLRSRIWIDFSSDEKVALNWERLIRSLFGKPIHVKPQLGKPPTYITDSETRSPSPATMKFNVLKAAILGRKQGLSRYRRDFLDSSIAYADSLRTRKQPDESSHAKKVLSDCKALKVVRDHITDWVLLESEAAPSTEFTEALIRTLERLRELKSRPREIKAWSEHWFEAHALFAYETFLYIVAALLKTESFAALHEIYTTHYLIPKMDRSGDANFESFDSFYAYSRTLETILAPEGQRLHSPAAELVQRQADREDIPFSSIIEADMLTMLMALVSPEARWFPQTHYYASYECEYLFFLRSIQHKYFKNLATVTGIGDVVELRKVVIAGKERTGMERWTDLRVNVLSRIYFEKWDSIK